MKQFSLTRHGRGPFYTCVILALLTVCGTLVSQKFMRARAQQLRPGNLSNLVRGYLAVSVGQSPKSDLSGGLFARGMAAKDIYLPGVEVFLDDPQTQRRSNVARTDLSGRFTLYAPEPGQYRICWQSTVYDSGCSQSFFTAGVSPQFVSTVNLTIPAKPDFVAITGHVTAADGSSVRTFDPMLNINAFATVGLDDENVNRLATVFVNNFGDYLLPYVPVKKRLMMTASIESAKFTQEIRPEAQIEASRLNLVNLKIQNSPPTLDPLQAVDSNNRIVQNAVPGSEITCAAKGRDNDGDALSFAWFLDPSEGQLSQTTGASVKWRLPQTPGRYRVTVVAYDKKGGYDKAVLPVLVSREGVPFSGIVVELDGTPVDQAEIEIVGNPVIKTGPNGRFSTYVTEATRYIFNVRKQGYALNSQIYDAALVGGRWLLRRGQVKTIDPTRDQEVKNERTQADCPGPDSARAGLGLAGDSLKEPQWQDGGGHVIDPPSTTCRTCTGPAGKEREVSVSKRDRSRIIMPRDLKLPRCGPGVSIKIPANSILDPNGIPATTPIPVTVATVDLLSPQQMPGDDSVKPISGPTSSLKSFGAGSLDLPPGFKLRSGAVATLTIPVDRARLMGGTLPNTVPLLSYDEQKGLWIEENSLALSIVNGVRVYVGNVTHFSEFNADTLFTNNACVRVFSDGIPGNYDLELMTPNEDGTPHYKTFSVDNTTYQDHVVYNIIPNRDITLAPMTQGANPQLIGFFVVNSGPITPFVGTPGVGNAPPRPYGDCRNFVVLKAGNAPDSPSGGEFLHGLGFIDAANLGFPDAELTSAGATGSDLQNAIVGASESYYNTIDPSGAVNSFEKFKAVHGFSQNPAAPATNETVASYANSGDLGFGRDMHCMKKLNNDVVCYVTNYGDGYTTFVRDAGTPDQDDANAAALRPVPVGASLEVATVAMEYSDLPGAPNNKVVKFYVYKKNLTSAAAITPTNPTGAYARSISANLDGRGERPVPQLCMICHGGQVPQQTSGVPAFGNNAQVNLSSRFLPFDTRLFTLPVPPATVSSQDAAFKTLNENIVAAVSSGAPGDPILETIHALYNDATHPNSTTQLVDSPVLGWQANQSLNLSGQTNFYNKVVANACRACHIAQPFSQLQFNTSASFVNLDGFPVPGQGSNNRLMLGTAELRACGDYAMPHALRTHDIFWANLTPPATAAISMPAQFQLFGHGVGGATWKDDLCTTFVSQLTSTPPGQFYEHTIQQIWNSKCVACHIGTFRPLTQDVSYAFVHTKVVPGNDLNSDGELLRRITGVGPEGRMPQNCIPPPAVPASGQLPCLTQSDIDKIKAWIRSGAN